MCLLLLIGVLAVRMLVPSPLAPRINVRWAAGLDPAARGQIEMQFALANGEPREGTTWAYDLGDPSRPNVSALISHPAVEDTANIDRDDGVVSDDAPRGTTVVAGRRWMAWRDAVAVDWVATFCAVSVVVSGLWLLLARDTTPRAKRT